MVLLRDRWLGRSALRKPRNVRFDDGHERTRSFELRTLLDARGLIAEMPSGAAARRSAPAARPVGQPAPHRLEMPSVSCHAAGATLEAVQQERSREI
jgi:hypothetical protein